MPLTQQSRRVGRFGVRIPPRAKKITVIATYMNLLYATYMCWSILAAYILQNKVILFLLCHDSLLLKYKDNSSINYCNKVYSFYFYIKSFIIIKY